MEVLRQAGIADADLLIAATSQDEINLLCCLSAHRLNKNIHTIARIRNPDYANQIYEMRETFALSLSVNPDKQAAAEIDRLLKLSLIHILETSVVARMAGTVDQVLVKQGQAVQAGELLVTIQ